MKRILVTGANGLIGWHVHARLHAANCAAEFKGNEKPYEIIALNHENFLDDRILNLSVQRADAILHFAGVNRAKNGEDVERDNPAIAQRLIAACKASNSFPHIVYANSTHSLSDSPYGRGKRLAADIISGYTCQFTNLILPHIFGECGRPFYNNVTATIINQIISGESVTLNPDGHVNLMHAGAAAQLAIELASSSGVCETVAPAAVSISVPDLYLKLKDMHALYTENIYPHLLDPFDLALFNSYRTALYPDGWPRRLKLNSDNRGSLFEAVKGGPGGQTFLSTTKSYVTRGDHFHLEKVERFLVLSGNAIIRIRKVLTEEVWEYPVSGDQPVIVDMPTLHTHSIENVGQTELLTLFWSHDQFDPKNPDTYNDKVVK